MFQKDNKQSINEVVYIKEPSKKIFLTKENIICCLLTCFSFFIHLFFLGHPSEVVFDEFHFGKFLGYYLKREFYFDVHPPLGKMLFSFVGYLCGYKGTCDINLFKKEYENIFPYVTIRFFSSLLGILLTPLMYFCLLLFGLSLEMAVLGAILITLDNGLVVQTRFILLDSPLLFFIMSTICFYLMSLKQKPFTKKWLFSLFMTGTSFSCATSVKLVGLFVVSLIGFSTIIELCILSDPKKIKSDVLFLKHFLMRFLFLLIWPFVFYVFFYYAHLKILSKGGPGDVHMSPEFQASLKNNHLSKTSKRVCYDAEITLCNAAEKVYLHSNQKNYPRYLEDGKVGSGGQQVAGSANKNSDSVWIIHSKQGGINVVKNGDIIRLEHKNTKRFLMSHDVASPLTLTNQEVTLQKSVSEGKINKSTDKDNESTEWRIEIRNTTELCSISSFFRLVHIKTGVVLLNYRKSLPKWGDGMREINGQRTRNDSQARWLIDSLKNPKGVILKTEPVIREASMLEKIIEVQFSSLRHNSKLTNESIIESRPLDWPFMSKGGIPFWVGKKKEKILFIGNKAVWYPLPFFIFSSFFLMLFITYFQRRNYICSGERLIALFISVFGYFLHFIPFLFMKRILYLHHYLPCILFGVMAEVVFLDFILQKVSSYLKWSFVFIILSFTGKFFFDNYHLTYGILI